MIFAPRPDPAPNPVRTCSSSLAEGRKCQAPARHGSPFCRHHDPNRPSSPSRRRASALDPDSPGKSEIPGGPARERALLRAHWRTYPSWIARSDAASLADAIENILAALAQRAIGHRSAGRIFAAIADRRIQLEEQAQQSAFLQVLQRAEQFAPGTAYPAPPFEAFGDLTSIELLTRQGPAAEIAINSKQAASPKR